MKSIILYYIPDQGLLLKGSYVEDIDSFSRSKVCKHNPQSMNNRTADDTKV